MFSAPSGRSDIILISNSKLIPFFLLLDSIEAGILFEREFNTAFMVITFVRKSMKFFITHMKTRQPILPRLKMHIKPRKHFPFDKHEKGVTLLLSN